MYTKQSASETSKKERNSEETKMGQRDQQYVGISRVFFHRNIPYYKKGE